MGLSKKMMSLQEFMRRQSVLRLYRSVLKTAQMAPDRARHDLYCEIRDEFDRHREEKDEQQVKFMIHTGKQRAEELKGMLMFQHSTLKPGSLPHGF